MAVTRLERKGKRNKSRAKNRVAKIKRLNAAPVIKNVDIEEIKKSFEQSGKKADKKPAAKKEEVKETAPKAEKETKKAEAKTEAKADKEEK